MGVWRMSRHSPVAPAHPSCIQYDGLLCTPTYSSMKVLRIKGNLDICGRLCAVRLEGMTFSLAN